MLPLSVSCNSSAGAIIDALTKTLLSLRNREQTELLFSILLETDRCQAFDCRRRARPDRKFSTRNIRRTQERVRTFPSPDILDILSWSEWPRQERAPGLHHSAISSAVGRQSMPT